MGISLKDLPAGRVGMVIKQPSGVWPIEPGSPGDRGPKNPGPAIPKTGTQKLSAIMRRKPTKAVA